MSTSTPDAQDTRAVDDPAGPPPEVRPDVPAAPRERPDRSAPVVRPEQAGRDGAPVPADPAPSAPSGVGATADAADPAPTAAGDGDGDGDDEAGPSAAARGTLLHKPVIEWFDRHARDLPWRRPEAGAWGVMVSEFMLQQTPVARVLPVYEEWLRRWPTPGALAAESPGEAVRAWGRLGYPRRALRLHAAAAAIAERFGGEVPVDHHQLLALPGVGEYTAAAVASFAYGQRHAVLDTNVRRVLARAAGGSQYPPNATTAAERRLARALLPEDPATAARWAAATMELGALVCTARTPGCARCPIAAHCAWQQAGAPADQGPVRRGQTYAGTDRQVRGKLLAVLRESPDPVDRATLDRVWNKPEQRNRALHGLVSDGLVERLPDGRYRLPGG